MSESPGLSRAIIRNWEDRDSKERQMKLRRVKKESSSSIRNRRKIQWWRKKSSRKKSKNENIRFVPIPGTINLPFPSQLIYRSSTGRLARARRKSRWCRESRYCVERRRGTNTFNSPVDKNRGGGDGSCGPLKYARVACYRILSPRPRANGDRRIFRTIQGTLVYTLVKFVNERHGGCLRDWRVPTVILLRARRR